MHLISNRWYAVLTPDEVPADKPAAFTRLGQEIVFWRDADGAITAALDICPHRRAKLSPGRIKDGCIECPFHGFRFNAAGACTEIPAHPDRTISGAMSLHTLPVRVAHGFVWLWTGPDDPDSGEIPFFNFAGYSWSGSGFSEEVATHYTRAIENQLDFTHLPFVHRSTIGRFVTEDMAVVCEVEGDSIKAHIGDPEAHIHFLGPNIWRNKTGSMWQFLAFVPVDDKTMRYYIRTYQRTVTVPGLDWLVGKASAFSNRFVLRQDTPVVETQPAEETRLRMGEVLVPSDSPIIAYRRWREARRFRFDPGRRLRSVPDKDAQAAS